MPPDLGAIVCVADGIFYAMHGWGTSWQTLWLLNTNDGTATNVGNLGFLPEGDLALYNGEVYFYSNNPGMGSGIVKVDLANPSNSTIVVPIPTELGILGLTASPFCNSLLGILGYYGVDDVRRLVLINLIDGALTILCSLPDNSNELTSMLEFAENNDCDNSLDLDCNDSSGATGADFNSISVSCVLRQAPIADEDVRLLYDDIIEEMTIKVIGFVPDGMSEVIDMIGNVPGINFSGQGTELLTLSNAGGAKSTDFIDALHLVRYFNTAFYPTAGQRTIEVQFSTASGSVSNVGIAFIQVVELPPLDVDLGIDQIICDGQSVTFDAGSFPGGMFQWSGGQMTQSITTSIDGQYSVIVSDATHCPGTDTVLLNTIPLINISLTGDVVICDNQSATLTLQTNAPFPITVVIEADPGSPFVLDDIMGNYSFTDLPQDNTTYTITSVTPSMEACITVTDGEQIIDVFPSYIHSFDVSICDGDSVWLGFYWETQAGTYENAFNTNYSCDSIVTTNISILPAVMIQMQSDTCDPAAAGVFITHLDNPNGCDTVVTTTVTLLTSDTTQITLLSCIWTQTGIVTDTFINQSGCDSLVITNTSYVLPTDTTFLQELTCDSSLLGISYDTLTNASNCDSIVKVTVSFSLIDTTYTFGTSCVFSEIGVFETLLTDAQGCDSLVISTVTQGQADTTAIFTTSCDPASLGVFEELLTTPHGCDSLIVTTVTFSAQDSTFVSSTTCHPSAAGIFITSLVNQFGCDSIVTETVLLLPSDATSFQSTTCDPSAAGVFAQMLTNQFGCDSIVTETVTLLPSDQTAIASTTCIASQTGIFITSLTNQYGCDSVITETITLLPGDTTSFTFNTCNPAQVGAIETVYTGHDGCDSLVIETSTLYPLPVLQVQSAIDYNGFDISCAGDADGSIIANAIGIAPFDYLWSTSDTDPLITGLSAGNYAVSVTDGNGCATDGVITLIEPELFMIGFEVSEPDCFDQQLGSITVKPTGGVAPYTYSIDGAVFQASPDFTGLNEGIYQVTALDANDCSATEIISIDVPLMVQVELGENQVISIGDSAQLQAIINLPFDSLSSILWTGIDSIDCPSCLTQIVTPIITTAYAVSVTSVDGCADRDSLTVSVTTDQQIYIPNIFSPNGDGINDVLLVSMGDGVQEISAFEIFDRWGNMVFQTEQVLPSGPIASWDGKMNGETMNAGVFTYKLVAIFKDGQRFVKYGDITLLR